MKKEPIEKIEWIDAEALVANDYNPNIVMNAELKALELNILQVGWVQPIIISKDKIIIDGFHRTMLSKQSKALKQKYDGRVPCVVFDVPRDKAMILTVRMNRAKGSHVALKMSGMIRELIDKHGWSNTDVGKEIGASVKEIDLLYQDSVFKMKNIKNYKYSKAWYPVQDK
tara:strand:- start:18375 stop:18884 length:510 start_codon:yes stop_codon:yes gene_type:complete